MKKYKLGDIATVEISGVDKKITDGEKEIDGCIYNHRTTKTNQKYPSVNL